MEKTATLNLRVNPALKEQAEAILQQLDVPMSTAINMFLRQVTLVGGIPFPVTLPAAPASIDMDQMTAEEIHAKLQRGLANAESGNVQDARQALQMLRERL